MTVYGSSYDCVRWEGCLWAILHLTHALLLIDAVRDCQRYSIFARWVDLKRSSLFPSTVFDFCKVGGSEKIQFVSDSFPI